METQEIVVLDPGVTAKDVAVTATCCAAGSPVPLRTEPPSVV